MSLSRAFSMGKGSVILALVALSSLPIATASAQQCDRDCLGDLITQYVDAVVARDPSRLPVADGVRFTEDSAELELGDGIWKSITGKGEFRHDYLDTAKQIAASHVVLLEGTNQILYSVLLYVQDRRIAGIETWCSASRQRRVSSPRSSAGPYAVWTIRCPPGRCSRGRR